MSLWTGKIAFFLIPVVNKASKPFEVSLKWYAPDEGHNDTDNRK